MEKLRCGSFFAGVGGIDIGFEGFGDKKSEFFEIVYANEYNLYSIKTYELNSSINGERIDRQYEQSSHSRVRIYTQTQA